MSIGGTTIGLRQFVYFAFVKIAIDRLHTLKIYPCIEWVPDDESWQVQFFKYLVQWSFQQFFRTRYFYNSWIIGFYLISHLSHIYQGINSLVWHDDGFASFVLFHLAVEGVQRRYCKVIFWIFPKEEKLDYFLY